MLFYIRKVFRSEIGSEASPENRDNAYQMFVEEISKNIFYNFKCTCESVIKTKKFHRNCPPPHCWYSPIFRGVSHSGYQPHSFGIMLRLCMQTQVTLHKVPGGHVMLSILHRTGILRMRQEDAAKNEEDIECLLCM